jgi:aldose sugar dehydrogenase
MLVGALAGQVVIRLVVAGDKVVSQERLFERELGRIRDVRQGPDGNIYVLTDSPDGELIRLTPEK